VGYQKVKKSEDTFTCFDRIYERDGRTDRQTGRAMTTDRAVHCIASHGKKTTGGTKTGADKKRSIYQKHISLLYRCFDILNTRCAQRVKPRQGSCIVSETAAA